METVLNFFTPILMLASSVMGVGSVAASDHAAVSVDQASVELGLTETSPRGAQGGFAMPASGCSAADPRWHGYPITDCSIMPDITTNKSIIRLGGSVIISWDPKIHQNCVLSPNVTRLNTPSTPDGNVAGSRTDTPTGETSYSIVCDGAGNQDSVTVKVLPRIQES